MNLGIGNKDAQFHFWEYINLIFGTVYLKKQIKEFNTRIVHTYTVSKKLQMIENFVYYIFKK
jgi:hypothetical protein